MMIRDEKARAYDKVVNKLKEFLAQGADSLITRANVQDFFPELSISDDELIRKEIIEFLQLRQFVDNRKQEKWIAWLEKQGEPQPYRGNGDTMRKNLIKAFKSVGGKHWGGFDVRDIIHWLESKDAIELEKPDEKNYPILSNSSNIGKNEQNLAWSDDDEKMRNKIFQHLGEFHAEYPELYIKDEFDWLESIKPQPKQKWSKDDEDMINGILYDIDYIRTINRNMGGKEDIFDKEENWLKSLKPHWKPTKEQMNALSMAYKDSLTSGENLITQTETLKSLYNDLKKL